MVTLVNPNLSADQTIDVPESSVWHYERSGWQVAPEGAPPRVSKRRKPGAPVTGPDLEPTNDGEVAPEGAPADPTVDAPTESTTE